MAEAEHNDQLIHDVVVVGAGSAGLTLAAALAQLGHPTTLIERHEQQYGLPRAGHIDHEIMRILQSLDAEAPVVADAYETEYYRWVNAHDEVLLDFPWGEDGVSGWHSDFMQNSAILEASLMDRVREADDVNLMCGWEVRQIDQRPDFIEVTLARVRPEPGQAQPQPTGEVVTLRARYLIGCDGAGSRIRTWNGIARDDLGFNEKWLVVDALRKRDFALDFDSGQICDPRRPITILPLGKDHRRWEWYIHPTEDPQEFEQPEKAWELLNDLGITTDDVEPVRQLVYTFEARMAQQWRNGRVLLAGDAAHTMPPFMGQGMCSGMRDAKNLAWKLDLVIRGLAEESLLDTYEQERRPHVYDWTVISLESGRVSCTVDPAQARQRDDMFRAGYQPPIPNFPQLLSGVLHRSATGEIASPAGELGVQGRVAIDGRVDLLDRLVSGRRFHLISQDSNPTSALDDTQRQALATLGVDIISLSDPHGEARTGTMVDVDGTYASWLSERGLRTVLIRPDFYVFGGVSEVTNLPGLIDQLIAQLMGTATAAPTTPSSVSNTERTHHAAPSR